MTFLLAQVIEMWPCGVDCRSARQPCVFSRRLVCVHLPRFLKKAVFRLVGKRGEDFLDAVWVDDTATVGSFGSPPNSHKRVKHGADLITKTNNVANQLTMLLPSNCGRQCCRASKSRRTRRDKVGAIQPRRPSPRMCTSLRQAIPMRCVCQTVTKFCCCRRFLRLHRCRVSTSKCKQVPLCKGRSSSHANFPHNCKMVACGYTA